MPSRKKTEPLKRANKGRPKVKKPVGRPSKFTPERIENILNYIRMGSWLEVACQANDICMVTLRDWLEKGNAYKAERDAGREGYHPHKKYAEFVDAVAKVYAESELLDVQRIDDAGEHDWRATAWKMARRWKDRWGDPEGAVNVKGKITQNHQGGVAVGVVPVAPAIDWDAVPVGLLDQLVEVIVQQREASQAAAVESEPSLIEGTAVVIDEGADVVSGTPKNSGKRKRSGGAASPDVPP